MSKEDPRVTIGTVVHNANGQKLGTVRGFVADGDDFVVTMDEGIQSLSVEHERSGHEFGEAELMWRCLNCGEMGEIDDDLPDECPNCGVQKEEIYYWTED